MKYPELPWDGGCRCGAVRFRITALPLLTNACHCTGCQRMTGSAFSLSIGMHAAGFAVTHGMPVTGGLRDPAVAHFHCDMCKSWLFTRPASAPDFVNVRATMLDDAGWFVPLVEFWTSEKLPAVATGARRSFTTQPDAQGFGALLAEAAAS